MAKKKQSLDTERVCKNCANNTGENMQFRYMWGCIFLPYCIPFGWHKCEAEEKMKGQFKAKK